MIRSFGCEKRDWWAWTYAVMKEVEVVGFEATTPTLPIKRISSFGDFRYEGKISRRETKGSRHTTGNEARHGVRSIAASFLWMAKLNWAFMGICLSDWYQTMPWCRWNRLVSHNNKCKRLWNNYEKQSWRCVGRVIIISMLEMHLWCLFCVCQLLSWDDPPKSYAFQGPHRLAYRASGVSWMNCKKLDNYDTYEIRFVWVIR